MTLTLVDAPTGSIEQHPSGLVVFRASDFLGPARGSLTTITDPNSLAGIVVKETQASVVPSTLVGAGTGARTIDRWPLASDTLRIPKTTIDDYLDLTSDTGFNIMVSMKVTGDVPSNARYKKSHIFFNQFAGGAAAGMGWGRDTTLVAGPTVTKTSLWGTQYKISPAVDIFWSFFSTGTNLTLRVWGVEGGTIEYALDLVYLMPFGVDGARLQHFLGGYQPFNVSDNGTLFVDKDNNASDNVIGKFSVGGIYWEPSFGSVSVADFQEAGNEPTAYNITDGTWFGSPNLLDPPSLLSFIAAPHYLPESTLIDEPFNGSATSGSGVSIETAPNGYMATSLSMSFGGAGHPNGTSGWTRDGAGNLRCSIMTSTGLPGGGPYNGIPNAQLVFGVYDFVSGSSTDPRNFQHTLLGLQDFICETTFSCDVAGQVNLVVGFQTYDGNDYPPGVQLALTRNGYGVRLTLAGATLTATLVTIESTHITSPSWTNGVVDEFSNTITVDSAYTPGTIYRIKVERRRYNLRAKVWLDGASEPSSWTFNEYMSVRWDEAGGPPGFLDYPYDDNWITSSAHDVVGAEIWYLGQNSAPGMICYPTNGVTTPNQVVTISNYKLWIDPVGASKTNMVVAEEDYDGGNRSNSVVVPYSSIPSARFVEGSLRNRHFSADTLGFNLLGWKGGSSGPQLQSSVLPIAWEWGVEVQVIALDMFFDDIDPP